MESEASEQPTEQPEQPEQSEVTAESTKPIKKVCSPAKMEALAKARLAAAEKKKALGAITVREKALKQKLLDDRIKELHKMEEIAAKPRPSKPKPKKKPIVVECSSSESESESESSSSEEDIPPPKSKKHASKSHLSNEVVRDNLKQKILRDNYKAAFASLFPGHLNMYD